MSFREEWPEYRAVSQFYGERTAKRSGVPLINHINEGLTILEHLEAGEETMRAWCLHPLFQSDDELQTVGLVYTIRETLDPVVMMLVMEYRNQANAWLSDKVDGAGRQHGKPTSGPVPEVREMLIADKVQNYKDFLTYHSKTHERSIELDIYFNAWLSALGINRNRLLGLFQLIDKEKA